jgi:hypothetical protein
MQDSSSFAPVNETKKTSGVSGDSTVTVEMPETPEVWPRGLDQH